MNVTVWDWYTYHINRIRPGLGVVLLGVAGPLLAIWGQWLLSTERIAVQAAFVVWLFAVGLSIPLFRAVTRQGDDETDDAQQEAALPGSSTSPALFVLRAGPTLVAVAATLLAFFANPDGRFTPVGVFAWIVAVASWFVGLWEGPLPTPRLDVGQVRRFLAAQRVTIRLPRIAMALAAVFLAAAFFRFHQLYAIPPEMTSDHVEKLLDVDDVLHGMYNTFFPRNTGREPLQFYFAAFLARALGTGTSFLTLKLTSAIAGLLTVPFIFLLGSELEDKLTGWLAAFLVAIAFWPNAISRVGLRFPFNPVFVAPTLYFVFRGLRRGSRNDFLWAGLAVGVGLYGYSPFRVMAVALAAIFGLFLIFPKNSGGRWRLVSQYTTMSLVALAVFAPLLRYATQKPDVFWLRTLRSVSDVETELPGSPWEIFFNNVKDGFAMFNVQGDLVWVNTIPKMPALDHFMGGLFVVGVAFLIYRLIVQPSLRDALILLLIPIFMLPSTLSLAYPVENPSVVRAGAAIVVVYLIVALPLTLMIRYYRRRFPGGSARHLGVAVAGAVLVLSTQVNYQLYFRDYPEQYVLAAQNASEIGQVISNFAHSVGSYDTAFVRAYPYWVDTRAVGIYAGRLGWDQVYMDNEQLARPVTDPRPKLFIVHPDDTEAQDVLRQTYPTGRFSVYASARPHRDFLMYLVPAEIHLNEFPQLDE